MLIEFSNRTIERGDIVKYEERICLVAESRYAPTIYLVNLKNGLITGEFSSIDDIRYNTCIALLAKNDDVKLSSKGEETF